MPARPLRSIVCLLLLLSPGLLPAQQGDTITAPADTTKLGRFRALLKKEAAEYGQKYSNDKAGLRQMRTLQELRYTGERARLYLRKAIDTIGYRRELDHTLEELKLLQEGIYINKGSELTTRNLAVTASILSELLVTINKQRIEISTHVNNLTDLISRIDSLTSDSSIFAFPQDSAATMQYAKRLLVVGKELGPADSALRASIGPATQLQTDYDLVAFDIRSRYEEIELLRKEQTSRQFDKEFPFIWEDPLNHRPLLEIIRFSMAKEKLALFYYLRDNQGRLFILVLLIAASWYFMRALKQRWLLEKEQFAASTHGELVLRYPLLSAIIMTVSIFQFLFLQPPFIFSFLLWTITALCLAILFYRHITVFWMRFWVTMVGLFLLAGTTNMLLQASRPERWWMLLLSLTGTLYGIYLLYSKHRAELKEKNIIYFIGFVVAMEAAATILNIAGRYNLSKTLLLSGYTGLVIAILFLWTIRLINEGLGIIAAIYKHPDRKFFYIDFHKVGEKAPGFFYVFLVIGWFILVGRNFYAFQQAATPFTEFLNTERTLGSYTFTINSLFIFLLIIAVATVLSQIISYFAGEPGDQRKKDTQARKAGVGSWLLLIRIFILTLGIWFAFAAAGIPMDKLAIVLGALGVGIGLGLQGLVSNLVSGLIIAFEKPVNVGDLIEVNGKTGTMKSIGFRSSVVNLSEGACLVVPNSDLLSHQLINWTMANNRRLLKLSVGVAYGSNLKQVKSLLEGIITTTDKVLQYPEPVVSVKGFADSAVEFELIFWVGHVRDSLPVHNDVVLQIDAAFSKEGIVIPFPQTDLHIIREQLGREKPPTGKE